MFERLIALTVNTFVETIRQPIYGVILLTTTLLLIFNVSLAGYTLDNDDNLLLDLGLSTLLMSGLFLSAFSATGVITREIENKTVLTVISKPVSRPLLIVGKFLGLLAGLGVAYYLSALVFLLCQRHGVLQNSSDPWDLPVLVLGGGAVLGAMGIAAFCNYFYDKDFPTTALLLVVPLLTMATLLVPWFDKEFHPRSFASEAIGDQELIAVYLVSLVVIVTAAVALAASTRFGQLVTLIICAIVLGVGISSDYIFGQFAGESFFANALYHTVPNVGPFWVVDGVTARDVRSTVPLNYVFYVTGYAALLTIGSVSLAIAAFQKREVG